jgi:hypothetical protein
MRAGFTIEDLIETVHVFPTYAEAWKLCALVFDRDPKTMSCCCDLILASAPTIFGLTGKIQGFFATYELHILTGALLLLGYALQRSASSLIRSCRLLRPQGR